MFSSLRPNGPALFTGLLLVSLTGPLPLSAQESTNHASKSRLFFSPTARAVGDGNGYVAIYELFFPYVAYGAGDRTTVAGGISINPGSGRFLYGGAKVTLVDRSRSALAIGGIAFLAAGDDLGGSAGLLQVVSTRGGSKGAISTGLAFGVAGGEIAGHPALVIGGDRRLSDSIRFVTENVVFVGVQDGIMISAGLRFVGERLTGDFGLFTFPGLLNDQDDFPLLPWVGYAYNFGE